MNMQGNYYGSKEIQKHRRNVGNYSRLGLTLLSILVVIMLTSIVCVAVFQPINNRSHSNDKFYEVADSCNKYILFTNNAIKFGQLKQAAIYQDKAVYYWNEEVKLINN